MSIQISKYDAIKAVIRAEETDNKLAYNMMQAIRRAMRKEMQNNEYNKYYIINEREGKYFKKFLYGCSIELIEDE